jgi:hypothetical protein
MKALRYTATPETLAEGGMPENTVVDAAGRLLATPGGIVASVTPVLDTSAYAADRLLFNSTAIASAAFHDGGHVRLESIGLLDEDDQGIAMDLLFLDASTSLGTINQAFAASDTLGRNVLGRVNIATGDYIDFGGFRFAQKSSLGIVMKAAAATSSLWVAGVTRGGTPTYTASGLKFKFGFSRL